MSNPSKNQSWLFETNVDAECRASEENSRKFRQESIAWKNAKALDTTGGRG
jgi:hypothetical protein